MDDVIFALTLETARRHKKGVCSKMTHHGQHGFDIEAYDSPRERTRCGKKSSPYSTAERRVPELIPVLCSQPAADVSHKPGGRLPLLSARPAVTPATLKRAATNFAAWRTEAQWV